MSSTQQAAGTSEARSVVLEDFRDEASALPHAAQLQKGYRWLRFETDLEQEFYDYYWCRYLPRVRMALLIGSLLLLPFSLRDYLTLAPEVWHSTVGIRLLGIMPLIMFTVLLTYWPRLQPHLEKLLAVNSVLLLAMLSMVIVIAKARGATIPYEGLMLVMVFIFFISGLRAVKATVTCLIAIGVHIASNEWFALPRGATTQQSALLLNLVVIGGFGSYLLEMAVRKNFLTEKLAEFRASRDPLTLLYNRRAALQHLNNVWRQAEREHVPVAVMLIDVDHFKNFNDIYGHLAGDGCLSEVAFTLATSLQRPLDMVARYGGEEFIAIAYGAGEHSLKKICERLRTAVHDLGIVHEGSGANGLLSVSIGASWATPGVDQTTPSSVLDEADRALYRAKDAGRNRWETDTGIFTPGMMTAMGITNPAAAR